MSELTYQEQHIADFVPIAASLARYRAWQPADADDLQQEGLLALVKSMREYKERQVDNPKALALTVMDAAMKWWYKPRDRDYIHTEVQDHHIVETEDDIFLGTFYREYLAEVERLLGGLARAIAENLVLPRDEVVDLALEDMRHKAKLKAQGHSVRGFDTCIVKQVHIQQALGIGETEWHHQVGKLRDFTSDFLKGSRKKTSPRQSVSTLAV